VPFRLLTTWLQGSLAIGVGAVLKRRLLSGALRLAPEELRHQGIGAFLGEAYEAEALETLALNGGVVGLLATIELAVSAFVLGRFAMLLLVWCCVATLLAWKLFSHYQRWTTARTDITQDLVETMVGHRTRLAQQPREKWHESEDRMLDRYIGRSQSMDRSASWLIAAIPRGWLIAGLACLAPGIVAARTSPAQVAVSLGGLLLAFTAFKRLTGSFADIASACVAWKRVLPLFRAAARPERLGEMFAAGETSEPSQKVIEADRLTFRYHSLGNPALQACSLAVHRGERILLEGPSGGGKTTFVSLLCGLREAESGLLLVNGLDRHAGGDKRWRAQVAAAPQFHENHILTETLAFNLLMGRGWPPTQKDMDDAEQICRELGLGNLLDRMPSGLMQMVGEGGWQLSHGERSRIYIARALLQKAELVILDESFAALDPENLRTALECTFERAQTLVVIAHP
jgi:ATP-binding cassette, subfamily B, bacterial